MKNTTFFTVTTVCTTLFAAGSDLSRYVDPFTGTAGTGHTHPAACVPFGMVQAGPDTGSGGWAYCPGYQFHDTSVLGYSLTHLSGTGCPDYNDVQILPFTGEVRALPMRSAIDKSAEKAFPGYYRVVQTEDGVETEVTAAKRAAIYSFTWRKAGKAKVLLNLPFGQAVRKTWDADVKTSDGCKIAGSYMRNGWISDRRIAFAFEFDRKWSSIEELPRKAADEAPRYVVAFDVAAGERTLVKVGLAHTDADGARGNLAADIPGWDFEAVRMAAREKWNALFARSTCEGTEDQKRNWYTALYHLYGQPNDYADADGRYSAADGKIRKSADGTYFTTLSLWDTFRAAQPWYTIATPEVVEPIIRSMLSHYATFGRLPVMSYGGKNVDCMVGNHSVPVIADAYLKGFRNFDQALMFEAITNTLTVAHPGKPKENWDLYDRYGCFPCDIIRGESVSRTLECSYDDWCAAQYLKATGHDREADFFLKRAQNWKNVFDTSIGFGRGKTSKGKWREPFNPYAFGHGEENDNDFTEGNAFQYSWHVMQDVSGLVAAMGGRARFVERLDALFCSKAKGLDTQGGTCLLDISGMIGQYVHGNEPSHHVIYFYPQVGESGKAAERIREVFGTQYHIGPEGLCGNDDCGQMSAWYVFSAMGFYPFNPCGGEYMLGAPQIPKMTLVLPGGKTFSVVAKNLSKENKYVKSVTLNGRPVGGFILRHDDIMKGGELIFEMGEESPEGERPAAVSPMGFSGTDSERRVARAPEPFREGERIVFLGDSITHASKYIWYLQLWEDLRHPGSDVQMMCAGLNGDTVGGALERLSYDVEPMNPDRVFCMFGMNDVGRLLYATKEPDKTTAKKRAMALESYRKNLAALVDRLVAIKAGVVLMTPSPYNQYQANPAENLDACNDPGLMSCAEIVRETAAVKGAALVDFNRPLTDLFQCRRDFVFCPDRVHPGDEGHLAMAALVLQAIGASPLVGETAAEGNDQGASFDYTPKALPFPSMPEYDRLRALGAKPSMADFNREIIRVTGLVPGDGYALKFDGREIGCFTGDELAAGVNIAELDTPNKRLVGTAVAPMRELVELTVRLRSYEQLTAWVRNGKKNPDDPAQVDAYFEEFFKKQAKSPYVGAFREWHRDYLSVRAKHSQLINREKELRGRITALRPIASKVEVVRLAAVRAGGVGVATRCASQTLNASTCKSDGRTE